VIISEHNPPLIVSVSHDRVWADAPLSHPHDRVCLLAPLTVEAASHSHTIGYEVYGIWPCLLAIWPPAILCVCVYDGFSSLMTSQCVIGYGSTGMLSEIENRMW